MSNPSTANTSPTAGLDGPSTPVRVEPLKLPQVTPAPKPEQVPA